MFELEKECLEGIKFVTSQPKHVTVFGSARVKEGHEDYEIARQIGRFLTEMGWSVMTGGGPGVMEAVSRGAFEADGHAIGIPIVNLPYEEHTNVFLHNRFTCHHFANRKYLLMHFCEAFIVLPGGYGTLDELFEALTLIKTDRLRRRPIFLYNQAFWQRIMLFIENECVDKGGISFEETQLMSCVDDLSELKENLSQLCLPT